MIEKSNVMSTYYYIRMKKLFALILLFFIVNNTFSQQRIVQGINALRGREIEFKFRSLSEISNGKSLGTAGIGYTEIYIYFDTVGSGGNFFIPEVTGWELVAYANTSTLTSDYGSPDMSLSEIKLRCTMTKGNGTVVADSFLSSDPNNVIASGNIGDGDPSGKSRTSPLGYLEWTVTISYDCGTTSGNGLLNYNADYYSTDLIIYIRPIYA